MAANHPKARTPKPEPQSGQSPQSSKLPETWPGAFGLYDHSKRAVHFNLATNVWITLISLAIGYIITIPIHNLFVGTIVDLIVSALFIGGQTFTQLAGVRGVKVSLNEALSKGFYYSMQMFFAMILIDLACIVSILLLVVPFFFVIPRLSLVYFFIVDKDMGAVEACQASWGATEGHAGIIWGIFGVILLIFVPFITVIGIPITIYLYVMYSASFAVLYEMLRKSPGKLPKSAASE